MAMEQIENTPFRIILITGVAGAGRTSALAALADMGFSTLDKPPINLLEAVIDELDTDESAKGVAIGIDVRSGGFSASAVADAMQALRKRADTELILMFMDCSDSVLLRRFAETRRRHPIGDENSVETALERERAILRSLREGADITLDTSDLSLTELRAALQTRFSASQKPGLTLSLVSFGFKHGSPREADIVFDVRFLTNPYWVPELRSGTGLDKEVADFVKASDGYTEIFKQFSDLLSTALPLYEREGKSYLTVAIGCTGGRHRSVAVTEELAATLRRAGYGPVIRHRDFPTIEAGIDEKRVLAQV